MPNYVICCYQDFDQISERVLRNYSNLIVELYCGLRVLYIYHLNLQENLVEKFWLEFDLLFKGLKVVIKFLVVTKLYRKRYL